MSDFNPEEIEISKTIDARGSACPGPLLEAKKGIGAVPVIGILVGMSGDASTKRDLPLWAKKVGHEYLGSAEGENFDRIFIRRKK